MNLEEFCADESAVTALKNFLASKEGGKFQRMLRAEHPLSKLASKENQNPANVRDLAIAENGTADNLLGKCIGWELVFKLMDQAQIYVPKKDKPGHESRAARITKTLRQTPTDK